MPNIQPLEEQVLENDQYEVDEHIVVTYPSNSTFSIGTIKIHIMSNVEKLMGAT